MYLLPLASGLSLDVQRIVRGSLAAQLAGDRRSSALRVLRTLAVRWRKVLGVLVAVERTVALIGLSSVRSCESKGSTT